MHCVLIIFCTSESYIESDEQALLAENTCFKQESKTIKCRMFCMQGLLQPSETV